MAFMLKSGFQSSLISNGEFLHGLATCKLEKPSCWYFITTSMNPPNQYIIIEQGQENCNRKLWKRKKGEYEPVLSKAITESCQLHIMRTPFPRSEASSQIRLSFALQEKFLSLFSLFPGFTLWQVLPQPLFPLTAVKWGACPPWDGSVSTACFLMVQVWRSSVVLWLYLFFESDLWDFWQYDSLRNFGSNCF